MQRTAIVRRDAAALRRNYALLRAWSGRPGVAGRAWAVIKAEAYGHGLLWAADALAGNVDGFAVSCIDEAAALRAARYDEPILVLQGPRDASGWRHCVELELEPVVHEPAQLMALEGAAARMSRPLRVPGLWWKLDTGMHRLGFAPEALPDAEQRIAGRVDTGHTGWMTHFACADQPGHALTATQRAAFWRAVGAAGPGRRPARASLANSAALISGEWFAPQRVADGKRTVPDSSVAAQSGSAGSDTVRMATPAAHNANATRGGEPTHWGRPGIALYGAGPLAVDADPEIEALDRQQQLAPVMTVEAPIIAVRDLEPGASVGYGATWTARRRTRMAVVAIGYADGYPRHAPNGTPVWVHGQRCPLIGRVSMDMITIDVSDLDTLPQVGERVRLWGEGVPVEEVAATAGTISYELLTRVHGRLRSEDSQ